ncbi:MAG: hypothetical protein A2Z27_01625 [candidate division Zixibacteria bacterium RBG_16_50_21]|nr:MAG: hypothetical protein A2Z27_01625 [candidate division Zixibacteria bacterium RBG_16_50_21]
MKHFTNIEGRIAMRKVKYFIPFFSLVAIALSWGEVPTTLNDFFLPGSQPNQSGQLETPDKCDNCHGGYNQAVEPAFNWRGSMMAQAARDPLFYACMAISNQDAPDAGDLCIRCHSPAGWLEGRSVPTDGSALNLNDRQGVQCDFCHKLVKPTQLGVNPYPNDPTYTSGTYPQDQSYLSLLNPIPGHSANGMYIADANNAKRGPFADADARHQFFYSPFHTDASLCGTCHDVSNPVYAKDSNGNYVPNTFDQASPSFDLYTMFPIERTFSEWKVSAYNSPGGVYAPQFGGNKTYVSNCQDCHLKDVTGVGCNKPGAPTRTDLPLHDMTGGNTFIPLLIPSLYPGEVDTAALNAGIQRATGMLQKAATLTLTVTSQGTDYLAQVNVTNETGHKLPSGYPEGRRIWINLRVYDTSGALIYQSGAYDPTTGDLTHDADVKIYEIKPGISSDLAPVLGYPAGPSFHFVLNNQIYEDNRIPPRGFTNANFAAIQSAPVGYTYADGQYWDQTNYSVPGAAARVVSTLYYQTTSKEYVEFLRDENRTNNWGQIFYDLWSGNGKSAPVAMATDTVQLQPIIINNPPVLASIGTKSVNEGQLLSFRISATDPDGNTLTLSIVNKPTGAVFVDSGNGAGSFVWTPAFDQATTYNVTFRASDGQAADSEVVQITVNNVNRPPVLTTIGNKSVDEGQLLSFRISASDPDGDVLALNIVNKPTGATFVDSGNGAGSFVWTPAYDQATVYNVNFKTTDGSLADSEVVTITVNNVNQAPVLEPIGPKTVQEDNLLQFRIFASDPDGTAPNLAASNYPAHASFADSGNGAGGFVFTPDTTQSGAYQVTFTASDGVLTDTEIITITVTETANQPPVLDSLGPKAVDEGQTLYFKVTASDPDGAFPALMVLNKPANANFADSGNGTGGFTFAPSFTQAGPYNVTFIASDGSLADSETVHITVDNVNRPPVLDSIGPQNVVVGNILSLRLSATDQDGTIPSLYAYQLPLNSVFEDSGNGRGSFVFAPETFQVADYQVSFVAGDGFLEDTSVVGISVTAAACIAMPGDANASGTYTLGDAIAIVNYIFSKPGCSPTPLCWLSGLLCRGDWNASNSVTLGDVIQAVNYLFNKQGGPWTPLPVSSCCQPVP